MSIFLFKSIHAPNNRILHDAKLPLVVIAFLNMTLLACWGSAISNGQTPTTAIIPEISETKLSPTISATSEPINSTTAAPTEHPCNPKETPVSRQPSATLKPGTGQERINAVAIEHHTENRLVVGTDAGVFLYKLPTQPEKGFEEIWFKATESQALSVAFNPDNSLLVAGLYDGTIIILDTTTGDVVSQLLEHSAPVIGVEFNPDGTLLASGAYDAKVIVWNLQSKQPQNIFGGHQGIVNDIAWSPDGRVLVSGSLDNRAIIWDIQTAKPLTTILTGPPGAEMGIASLAWSTDGTKLVLGWFDTTVVSLWDVSTGKKLLDLTACAGPPRALAWSPDGAMIAGEDRGIDVWNANTGQTLYVLQGHTDWVTGISWLQDSKSLISGSWDGSVILWHIAP